MTLTDTGNELSEILSGDPAPAAPVADTTTTAVPADTGPGRDEHGRFAPRAGETQPGPAAPAVPAAQPATTEEQPGATVPLAALHAERQKNADLGRQIAELNARFDGFSRAQPRPAPTPQEQPKPLDPWDDPGKFAEERARTVVTPIENMVKGLIFNNSVREAVREHGQEKITAAEEAMKAAIGQKDPDAMAAFQRLGGSFDPVGDVVKWHQRHQALTRVGSDPDKWLETELERRLSDPTEQAKILARIQASAAQPGNRSATPAIALPPSLSRLPGGTNTAAAGLGSDEERFKAALAR